MRSDKKDGIIVSFSQERVAPATVSQDDAAICFENQYQKALGNQTPATLFPWARLSVAVDGTPSEVAFSVVDEAGNELLHRTKDYSQTTIPEHVFRRIDSELARIHRLADDARTESGLREFYRNFRLLDPREYPWAWRVKGVFRKRVWVLWGLERAYETADETTDETVDGTADKTQRTGWYEPAIPETILPSEKREPDRIPVSGNMVADNNTVSDNKQIVLPAASSHHVGTSGGGWTGTTGGGFRNKGCLFGRKGCLPKLGLLFPGLLLFALMRGCLPGCQTLPPGCSLAPGVGGGSGSAIRGAGTAGAPSLSGGSVSDGERPLQPTDNPLPVIDISNCGYEVVGKVLRETDEYGEVEFSVVASDGRAPAGDVTVTDWTVNQEVKSPGAHDIYSAKLLYSTRYVVSATVSAGGRAQRVAPYRWDCVDDPQWKIVRYSDDSREYKVVCLNSSALDYSVTNSHAVFHGKTDSQSIAFTNITTEIHDGKYITVGWDSGGYRGEYWLSLNAGISGRRRSLEKGYARTDRFAFAHDSMDKINPVRMAADLAKRNTFFCLAERRDGGRHNGTAFAVSDRRLITNYHVAVGGMPEYYNDGEQYAVKPVLQLCNEEGRVFHAVVLDSDKSTDLALLELCGKDGRPTEERLENYFQLADEADISGLKGGKGSETPVIAIGYPRGTVKHGPPEIVDGKVEDVVALPGQGENIRTFVDIVPGYSGGPLVSVRTGKLLGVNKFGLAVPDAQQDLFKGARFSSSANEIRRKFGKHLQMKP